MKISLTVKSKTELYQFSLVTHVARIKGDLMLPDDFYAGQTVVFPQWEIQILDPIFAQGQTGKLNYHFSEKDNQPYVCFPGPLQNKEAVENMLRIWAPGQVCVMELDLYLNQMLRDAGGRADFLAWAADKHGIRLVSYLTH